MSRFSLAERTAIDLNLDHPVLLHITVNVHYCASCHHYFRAQPPFLRADAIYTNRVITKAVQLAYHDNMAVRKTAVWLARDFWVNPSESMIRQWCRTYGATFNFETDYQLLGRPEQLNAEEQAQVAALPSSLVGFLASGP